MRPLINLGRIEEGTADNCADWLRGLVGDCLKFGPENAWKIMRCDLNAVGGWRNVATVFAQVCNLYPELAEYTRDDTLEALAANMKVPLEIDTFACLHPGQTPEDIRSAFMGFVTPDDWLDALGVEFGD